MRSFRNTRAETNKNNGASNSVIQQYFKNKLILPNNKTLKLKNLVSDDSVRTRSISETTPSQQSLRLIYTNLDKKLVSPLGQQKIIQYPQISKEKKANYEQMILKNNNNLSKLPKKLNYSTN